LEGAAGEEKDMTIHGIDLNTEAIYDFCRRWKIRELRVFGSILRDDFGPESDIDFLADFEQDEEWDLFDELRMQNELAELVGREVDILSRYAIETDSNWRFRREVLSSSERIYDRELAQ
jgi:uncharacterized protein